MKEKTISFETALLAKEKGFDVDVYERFIRKEKEYKRPTQSFLATWLRIKHNIFVSVLPFQDIEDNCELCWYYTLVDYNDSNTKNDDILCNENHLCASIDNFEKYEEAFEEVLVEALKLISI